MRNIINGCPPGHRVQRMSARALACVLAVAIACLGIAFVATSQARAASSVTVYNAKGATLGERLGITRQHYIDYLLSHMNDDYYLKTPYGTQGDMRNPKGDCAGANGTADVAGQAAMNCTGFVWHTLYKASGWSYQKALDEIPCWGGVGKHNWREYLRNGTMYTTIKGDTWTDTIDRFYQMASEGQIVPGDIIWTWDLNTTTLEADGLPSGSAPHHHIYIYLGAYGKDTPGSYNAVWHSSYGPMYVHDATGNHFTEYDYDYNAITMLTPKAYSSPSAMTIVTFENKGAAKVKKVSDNPGITSGNALYGLGGLKFGLFSDEGCTQRVATLTVDGATGESNEAQVAVGRYYLKEDASALGGYAHNTKAYAVDVTANKTAVVQVGNTPLADVPTADGRLLIEKRDADLKAPARPQGNASLAGAQFTVSYYQNTEGTVSGAPDRTWVFETDSQGAVELDEAHRVAGDELYRNAQGQCCLPVGTYKVVETKAPRGYLLPDPANSANWTVQTIKSNGQGVLAQTWNTVTASEDVARGGVVIGKGDAQRYSHADGTYWNYAQGDATFAGARFDIVNDSAAPVWVEGREVAVGGVALTIETAYDGQLGAYVAATDPRALPYGSYIAREAAAPQGMKASGTTELRFTIASDGQVVRLLQDKGMLDEVVRGGVEVLKNDKELGSSQALAGSGHSAIDAPGYEGPSLVGIEFAIANASAHGIMVDGRYVAPGDEVTRIKTAWDAQRGCYRACTPADLLPYGTYTIAETATNETYLLTDGQPRTFQVRQDGQIVSADTAGSQLAWANQVVRNDLQLSKKGPDGRKLANVAFLLTNTTSGEAHVAVTDRNGRLNTAARPGALHSTDTNANDALAQKAAAGAIATEDIVQGAGVWFGLGEDGGMAAPDDGLGALPFGHYALTELRCQANEGLQLVEDEFWIDGTRDYVGVVDLGTIDDDDTPEEQLPWVGTVAHDVASGTRVSKAGTVAAMPADEDGAADGAGDETADGQAGEPADETAGETADDAGDKATDEIAGDAATGARDASKPQIGPVTASIIDVVAYKNFEPGREYTIVGTLMDKKTGQPLLDAAGNQISAQTVFTARTGNGTVEVRFDFDASGLAGVDTVVFERVFDETGALYVAHEDLGSEGQTIVFSPAVATQARDAADGDQAIEAAGQQTIVDTVRYQGLEKGATYALTGTVMNKATGLPLQVDGQQVRVTKTFEAADEAGTVEVAFTFDATGLADATLVVFEQLSQGDQVVAVHRDLDDEGQTIVVGASTPVPTPEVVSKTTPKPAPAPAAAPKAEKSGIPKTGDANGAFVVAIVVLMAGAAATGSVVLFSLRRSARRGHGAGPGGRG